MAELVVEAPMLGRVIRVHVKVGDEVKEGAPLCDMESLKMEVPILAPVGGMVKAVHAEPGKEVEGGDPLVVLET